MASVTTQMTAARRKLPVIPTKEIINDLSALQTRVAEKVIGKLRHYPPTLEGQRYRRTGSLGRNWRHTASGFRVGSGVTLNVYNNVVDPKGKRYASWVQDVRDQKEIHQGRWLTIQEAMGSERAEYRRDIKRILVSHGLT